MKFLWSDMIMADVITIIILSVIIGLIVRYLYWAKKRGETCIGCPYAKQCGGKCGGHDGNI